MRYMGSKNRHAKELLPIILENRLKEQWYVEPFVGGFNMIDKVKGNRIANDINHYVIELYKEVQKGWIPPSLVTKELYIKVKETPENYPAHLVGFIGFGCSYSGKWFGGYATGGTNSNGTPRNYAAESQRNIIKQSTTLKNIQIFNKEYYNLEIPDNSIIYCDPPYSKTTGYKNVINHEDFWNWVRKMSKKHRVYISEYEAPKDFKCIWTKKVSNTLSSKTKKNIEKLFIWGNN
jgi:DNA adenine methylase